jgi:flagellar biogenesis protein FliO
LAKNNNILRRSLLTTAVIVTVAVIGLFLMPSDDGRADQSGNTSSSGAATAESVGTSDLFTSGAIPTLGKMIGALLVVILCIYVGIYLMKKTMGGRYGSTNKLNALEVLESTGVGPKQSVTLIRVGEKSVLVGITGERMALLTELNAEDTAALMTSAPADREPDAFSRMLSTAAAQVKKLASKSRRTAFES